MAPKVLAAQQRAASNRRLFAYVAMAAFAMQVSLDLTASDMADAETVATGFAVPAPMQSMAQGAAVKALTQQRLQTVGGFTQQEGGARGRPGSAYTQRSATATVASRVINAMGAGAVASVIQAALSAVGEPIVNRVLVKRMKIMEAVRDVSPAQMLNFFKTTLTTNFLKFPFFEAINAFCSCFPFSGVVRGIFTGFVFTSATLPITNFRYRKSMELEVNFGDLYEAYIPTVLRDIVYGIARNYCTMAVLAVNPVWTIQSPETLFIVVILGCLISAPFNEWRGYLLQSKGQELSFSEFFKPSNFVRSTSLGALKQGISLALGYWCAPPATRAVNGLIAAIKGA